MEKRYRTPNLDNDIYNPFNKGESFEIGNYQEYYIINGNIIFKITIERYHEYIFIKCKNYSIFLNKNEFNSEYNTKFNSISEVFEFINNNFEENKVKISNEIKYKKINLLFNQNIELSLKYNNYDAKK